MYATIYEICDMFNHCTSFLLYGRVNIWHFYQLLHCNISYIALHMLGYLIIFTCEPYKTVIECVVDVHCHYTDLFPMEWVTSGTH